MGGMQVLQWAASYPDRVFSALPIAAAARHSAQNIAFHEVGPSGHHGRSRLARRQLSQRGHAARQKASRWRAWARISPICPNSPCTGSSAATFRIAPRRHSRSTPISRSKAICATRACSFVERFDANSYLYVTRAMDYFDLAAEHGGHLAQAFKNSATRFCVISFTSDWLFPTSDSRAIVHALNAAGGIRRLRRGGERQGSRRLPARRTRDVRGGPRLHRRRRACTGNSLMVETTAPRLDFLLLADMVAPGSRVLDIGCGDGDLLSLAA